MARYKGTCIGGVADGHWIEREDPAIRIDKRRPAQDVPSRIPGEVAFRTEETLESTDYKFLLLLGTSNTEIGVWAPQDITLEQVVTRLVKCYNPRTGLIGEPKANIIPIKRQ